MNTRRLHPAASLLAAGLLSTFCATALRAQDAPPPAPAAPVAPAAGGEAVKLAFKHRPGQVQKFRSSAKMDFTITPEGGGPQAAALGPIPLSMYMVFASTEKILGVKNDVATISQGVDSMTMTTEAFGNQVVMKAQGGKITTLVNGQKMDGNATGMDPAAMASLSGKKPIQYKREASGKVSGLAASQDPFSSVFGTLNYMVQFPDRPVAVGDSWQTSQKLTPPVPGGAAMAMSLPEFTVQFTHTVRSIDTRNGKRQALIESVGSMSAPDQKETVIKNLSQNINGLTRFDLARGVVVSGQLTMDMAMSMAMPGGGGAPGAAPPPGAPTGIKMDGTMEMKYTEAVAVPAKKPARAPAKKPVRRRK